jgi:hypothetical protein
VIVDIDIWRAANLLIQRHGTDAEIVAAQRADEMLDRGDRDGQLVWMRIRRAIAELRPPGRGSTSPSRRRCPHRPDLAIDHCGAQKRQQCCNVGGGNG